MIHETRQKRTKWKHSSSAVFMNDKLERKQRSFYLCSVLKPASCWSQKKSLHHYIPCYMRDVESWGHCSTSSKWTRQGNRYCCRARRPSYLKLSHFSLFILLLQLWQGKNELPLHCILPMAWLVQALSFIFSVAKLYFIQNLIKRLKREKSRISSLLSGLLYGLEFVSSCNWNLALSKMNLQSRKQYFKL